MKKKNLMQLHNKNVIELHSINLPPGADEEMKTSGSGQCSMSKQCPESCRCEGTIVDCSGRKLNAVPSDIPAYVTEL